jgi:hypothetical protein
VEVPKNIAAPPNVPGIIKPNLKGQEQKELVMVEDTPTSRSPLA